jgi:hypothetical protein
LAAAGGLIWLLAVLATWQAAAGEPPVINPFGPPPAEREDAVPGYLELSDGSVHPGLIYLTRDKRLQISDEQLQRQREVPLQALKQIDCQVKKEWMEKEWKFKETTSDEKMYTGRSYPAREYVHTITLQDGRTIEGGLSGIIYVQPPTHDRTQPGIYRPTVEAERYIVHKRDKGEMGTDLQSLVYVKLVKLGEEALKEGQQKAAGRPSKPKPSDPKKRL